MIFIKLDALFFKRDFCPQDNLADAEERIEKLVTQKADYEQQLKELEERLLDQEDEAGEMGEKNKKLQEEVKELKADVEELENNLAKVRYSLLCRAIISFKEKYANLLV